MYILVTGGTGFVGGAVIRALQRHGHTVLTLLRNPDRARSLLEADVAVAFGTMHDPDSYGPLVNQVEAVIHAAQEKPQGRWSRRKIAVMHRTDALMTRTLAAACVEQGKPFLYTSGALTHMGHGDDWTDETTPPRPCLLARGHAEMEAELLAMHRDQGLHVLILSPGFVYGAGGLLKTIVDAMLQGRYKIVGNGDNWWSMVHVDDVGEAYALALENGRAGESYFLGDNEPLRRREVIDRIADALGRPRVGRVARCLAGLVIGFPMVEAVGASMRLRNAKAKRDLGWHLRYATFAEGLPNAIKELRHPPS
jgi:nucleoside-diphosphate-sugar epimerase